MRIADVQLQHEAVHLRFRQRIGALLLERVLRRENQKRLRQGITVAGDRYLPLLHRFQQRRLHFGRRTVNLISQQQVGEYGTPLGGEAAFLLIIDHRTNQVGG